MSLCRSNIAAVNSMLSTVGTRISFVALNTSRLTNGLGPKIVQRKVKIGVKKKPLTAGTCTLGSHYAISDVSYGGPFSRSNMFFIKRYSIQAEHEARGVE